MDIGLTTLAEEVVAYDGGDWETKHRQQVEEREAREEGGLVAPVNMQPGSPGGFGAAPAGRPGMPPGAPPEPPEEDPESPEED